MRRSARSAAAPTDLDWGVSRGLSGFRALAWTWALVVTVATRADLSRPAGAIGLLALTGAFTAAVAVGSATRHRAVTSPVTGAIEVVLASMFLVADGWVYGESHGQTFGSAWPVAAAMSMGVRTGPFGGAVTGIVLGAARAVGSSLAPFDEASALALTSSAVLFTLAGGAAGAVMDRVRQAETSMARARAREEVARTLHDGVLQTLAVVQRRSDDRELAALAREQELELRAYLSGSDRADTDLPTGLRRAAAHVERHHGLRCEVLVIDDGTADHVDPAVANALTGAAREALNNAAKHASASKVTILLDVGDEVTLTIKDDGTGFDPAVTTPGRGQTESIHARLVEIGGTSTIDGRPGAGTEVTLTAPLRPRQRP